MTASRGLRTAAGTGGILLSALGTWGLWRIYVATLSGQLLEQRALEGSRIGAHYVSDHARALLSSVTMPAVVALAVLLLALSLWRGSRHRTLWAVVVLVGANVTTQVLKHLLLDRPDWGYSERWDAANTLPSGHTTIAAAAGVALILVVPARWRGPAAWAAALLAAATGYSTLVCQWHRPADVLAALLVTHAWGLLATLPTPHSTTPRPEDPHATHPTPTPRPSPGRPRPRCPWATALLRTGLLALAVATATELLAIALLPSPATRLSLLTGYAAGASATVALSFLSAALIARAAGATCGTPQDSAAGSDTTKAVP